MTPVLNGEVLKGIAHKSHTATVVATALALRQRMRAMTDITNVRFELSRANEKIDYKEYMQFWKDLQSVGVGSIIYGRKGNHDKFAWNYSLKSIGKSMLEGGNVDTKRITEEPKRKPVIERSTSAEAAPVKRKPGRPRKGQGKNEVTLPQDTPTGKIVYVALRPGFNIEVNLPIDVSSREIGLIYDAIKKAL